MLAPCVIVVSVEVQGIVIGNAVGIFIFRVCRRSLFHKVSSVGIIELLFKLGLFITQMVVCIFTHQFDVLQRSNRHLSEDTDIVFLDSRRISETDQISGSINRQLFSIDIHCSGREIRREGNGCSPDSISSRSLRQF